MRFCGPLASIHGWCVAPREQYICALRENERLFSARIPARPFPQSSEDAAARSIRYPGFGYDSKAPTSLWRWRNWLHSRANPACEPGRQRHTSTILVSRCAGCSSLDRLQVSDEPGDEEFDIAVGSLHIGKELLAPDRHITWSMGL